VMVSTVAALTIRSPGDNLDAGHVGVPCAMDMRAAFPDLPPRIPVPPSVSWGSAKMAPAEIG